MELFFNYIQLRTVYFLGIGTHKHTTHSLLDHKNLRVEQTNRVARRSYKIAEAKDHGTKSFTQIMAPLETTTEEVSKCAKNIVLTMTCKSNSSAIYRSFAMPRIFFSLRLKIL